MRPQKQPSIPLERSEKPQNQIISSGKGNTRVKKKTQQNELQEIKRL